jgi:hypothetical protein
MIRTFEELTNKIEFLYCNNCKEKIYEKSQILTILHQYPAFLSTYFEANRKNSIPFPDGFGLCPFKSDCGGRLIASFPNQKEEIESFLMELGEDLDDKYLYREFSNGLPESINSKSNYERFFSNILKKVPFFVLTYSFIQNSGKQSKLS